MMPGAMCTTAECCDKAEGFVVSMSLSQRLWLEERQTDDMPSTTVGATLSVWDAAQSTTCMILNVCVSLSLSVSHSLCNMWKDRNACRCAQLKTAPRVPRCDSRRASAAARPQTYLRIGLGFGLGAFGYFGIRPRSQHHELKRPESIIETAPSRI